LGDEARGVNGVIRDKQAKQFMSGIIFGMHLLFSILWTGASEDASGQGRAGPVGKW